MGKVVGSFILICLAICIIVKLGRFLRRVFSESSSGPSDSSAGKAHTDDRNNGDVPGDPGKTDEFPLRHEPEHVSLTGKCAICGEEFSASSLKKNENFLSEVSYEFYGKERKETLCQKCLQLMREEGGITNIRIT